VSAELSHKVLLCVAEEVYTTAQPPQGSRAAGMWICESDTVECWSVSYSRAVRTVTVTFTATASHAASMALN
jgi:hypothetical protein